MAYGSLLQERRKTLHARIVEAIERLYPDRLDEHVERLAHHALRAERWEQAVAYCRQAGAEGGWRARPTARRRPGSSRRWTALRHLPESRDTLEQAIDLRLDLRNALHAARRASTRILRVPARGRGASPSAWTISAGSGGVCASHGELSLARWASTTRRSSAASVRVAIGRGASATCRSRSARASAWRSHCDVAASYRQAVDRLPANLAALDGDRRRERLR